MPKQVGFQTEKKPSKPAAKAPSSFLPVLSAYFLLAFLFFLVLQPSLRMLRLWVGQDGFNKHQLDFRVGEVPAEWGYAAWTGTIPNDVRNHYGFLDNKTRNVTFTIPPKLNQNIDGGSLVIHGATFQAGFGTHAPSKIALSLQGKYSRFSCRVGLDATSAPHWGVIYVVLADGREIFRSPKMESDADAFPINVPVTGVKELILYTDNTEFDNIESNVDWVDLNFIP